MHIAKQSVGLSRRLNYFNAGSKQCVIVRDDNLDLVRLAGSGHGRPSHLTVLIGPAMQIPKIFRRKCCCRVNRASYSN